MNWGQVSVKIGDFEKSTETRSGKDVGMGLRNSPDCITVGVGKNSVAVAVAVTVNE